MPDLYHYDDQHLILDLVDNSVIANADPVEVIRPSELFTAMRTRLIGELSHCRD